MAKASDATHLLTWDENSLSTHGIEVATVAVEHGYVDGYGPGKVWEVSATFRRADNHADEIRPFSLTVAVLDEVGVELNRLTEPTRRGTGPFHGTASARIVAYPRSDSAYKRVSHLYASVAASAPHPDEPPLILSVDRDTVLLGHAGIGLEAVKATASSRSWSGGMEVKVKVRARVDPSASASLDVKGLDDDGFPVEGFWPTLDLSPDPATSGIFVGELSIETRTLPSRIVVTPANQYPHVQAASLLGVDAVALDAAGLRTNLVASAATIVGQPESVIVRVSGTMEAVSDAAGVSDEFALFVEVLGATGRLMWTETVYLAKAGSTPAPVAIEFTIFRADRFEEPTSLRLTAD